MDTSSPHRLSNGRVRYGQEITDAYQNTVMLTEASHPTPMVWAEMRGGYPTEMQRDVRFSLLLDLKSATELRDQLNAFIERRTP